MGTKRVHLCEEPFTLEEARATLEPSDDVPPDAMWAAHFALKCVCEMSGKPDYEVKDTPALAKMVHKTAEVLADAMARAMLSQGHYVATVWEDGIIIVFLPLGSRITNAQLCKVLDAAP